MQLSFLMRANACFFVLWLLWLVWCYKNSFDDPSSVFYDESTAYTMRYSAVRAAEVDGFLRDIESQITTNEDGATGTTGQTQSICIGVPSINRKSEFFLQRTVASLVDTLSEEERASIRLVVLLADNPPRKHFAYGKPWLEHIADEVLVYDVEGADEDKISKNDNESDSSTSYRKITYDVRGKSRGKGRVENMRLDHSVLVEACRNHGSPYFALLEDDVIASRDWLGKLTQGIEYVERQSAKTQRDWIYLRLFYSEIFMGWNNEEISSYMQVIGIVYFLALACLFELRRRHKLGPSGWRLGLTVRRLDICAALIICIWIPAIIALVFMGGRITMRRLGAFALPEVREMEHYGCCAQGVLFPLRQLDGVLTLFREPPYRFPGDMILEWYADEKAFSRWALEPSVLQHAGLNQSSERSTDTSTRAEVWNFSFERLPLLKA